MNTRLPELYFADAAYFLLQHNLQRIESLSPRGMSGQVEQGIANIEVWNVNRKILPFDIHNSMLDIRYSKRYGL